VSFEIGFEGGVGVDRSKMRREGVPNRGASMPKTTRGKSNLDAKLGEKIGGGGAKLTYWETFFSSSLEFRIAKFEFRVINFAS